MEKDNIPDLTINNLNVPSIRGFSNAQNQIETITFNDTLKIYSRNDEPDSNNETHSNNLAIYDSTKESFVNIFSDNGTLKYNNYSILDSNNVISELNSNIDDFELIVNTDTNSLDYLNISNLKILGNNFEDTPLRTTYKVYVTINDDNKGGGVNASSISINDTATIGVTSLTKALSTNDIITFFNGAKFTLTLNALLGATTITGQLTINTIATGQIGTIDKTEEINANFPYLNFTSESGQNGHGLRYNPTTGQVQYKNLGVAGWTNISAAFLDIKLSCVIATTDNLSATYNNGTAGVGATLVSNDDGAFPEIDDVTLNTTGKRIIVKDQTDKKQNGIYQLSTVGTGTTSWVLTRTTDADTPAKLNAAAFTVVELGTVSKGKSFVFLPSTDPVEFGITELDVTLLGSSNAITQVNNPSDNRILTISNQSNTIMDAEANLTFDGTNLVVVGNTKTNTVKSQFATTGLDIQFDGETTKNKITLTNNLADALNITENTNSYMQFITTDNNEEIVLGKPLKSKFLLNSDFVSINGANTTYTIENFKTGLIRRDCDDNIDKSDNLPTPNDIVSGIPNAVVGNSFEFVVENISSTSGTVFLLANGNTVSGNMEIKKGLSKKFLAVITNTGTPAVSIHQLGGGGDLDALSDVKFGGTDFPGSLLIGHTSTGILNAAQYNLGILGNSLKSITVGDHNIALGYRAGEEITSGYSNIAIGKSAGDNITTGDYNIAIGFGSKVSSNDALNEIVIGHNAIGQGNNSVTLGDDSVTDVYCSEDKGATLHSSAIMLTETTTADPGDGFGRLWVKDGATTSDPNKLYFTTDAGNDIQLTSGNNISDNSISDEANNLLYSNNQPIIDTSIVWQQIGSKIDGENDNDYNGFSVSLSANGMVVAIGSPGPDSNTSNYGSVRVYQYNSSSWSKLGSDIDGDNLGDFNGCSVSLSADGMIVVIGAILNDGTTNNTFDNRGVVRIYQRDISEAIGWKKLGIDIIGENASDQNGRSVSTSADGTIIAIGSPFHENRGKTSIYMYRKVSQGEWDSTTIVIVTASQTGVNSSGSGNRGSDSYSATTKYWIQLGNDIDGELSYENSGWSVSLSADGTIIAIGSPSAMLSSNTYGRVRIYKFNGVAWNKLNGDIIGDLNGDHSGNSVSINSDGNIVAIGAPRYDTNGASVNGQGRVKIYQKDPNASIGWTQLGDNIDGDNFNKSGQSVSLSADGTIIAIGAPSYDADGTNPDYNHGAVRVYKFNGVAWNKLGLNISGQSLDYSGFSVSLSANGKIVAIGSPFHNNFRGTTHIYNLSDEFLNLAVNNSIILKQKSSASADITDYGQLWVKDTGPNELYFTTGAGNDIQITSGTSLNATVTLDGLTDVKFGGTNFGGTSSPSLLIGTNTPGTAPSHGTLNSANDNIGIGFEALKSLTSGKDNVIIGNNSGKLITSSNNNLLLGSSVGVKLDGGNNVFMGYETAKECTSGYDNVAIGYQSSNNLTTGNSNVFIGSSSGSETQDGIYNVCIGASTSASSSNAENQIVIGYNVTGVGNNSVTLGDGNILNVYCAEDSSATLNCGNIKVAPNSTIVAEIGKAKIGNEYTDRAVFSHFNCAGDGGSFALAQTSSGNTTLNAKEYQSIDLAINGSSVISVLSSIITLGYNFDSNGGRVVIGGKVVIGESSPSSSKLTIEGSISMKEQASADSYDSYYGQLWVKEGATTSDPNELYFTNDSGNDIQITSGTGLNAGGSDLDSLTDVKFGGADFTNSLLIGHTTTGSLNSSNPAERNLGIMVDSLKSITTGDQNIAIGYQSLKVTTTGLDNIAIGYQSGVKNTGSDNIFIGNSAGLENISGIQNVVIGSSTGETIVNGEQNVVIGYQTDVSSSDATNQIVIGGEAIGVTNNSVTLGNSSVTDIYCSQDKEAKVHAGGLISKITTSSISSAGDETINFTSSVNFYFTMSSGPFTRNFLSPTTSGSLQGQSGQIFIKNDATNPSTITWEVDKGWCFESDGGGNIIVPNITGVANAIDVFNYIILEDSGTANLRRILITKASHFQHYT